MGLGVPGLAGLVLMDCSYQDAQPSSGLLQASAITLYTMFVTWLALSNVPGEYRPGFEGAWACSWALETLTGARDVPAPAHDGA